MLLFRALRRRFLCANGLLSWHVHALYNMWAGVVAVAKGNAFALGTYDATTEHMTLTGCKTVAEGVEYAWTATGTYYNSC